MQNYREEAAKKAPYLEELLVRDGNFPQSDEELFRKLAEFEAQGNDYAASISRLSIKHTLRLRGHRI